MKKSQQFERQIARILRILEAEDARVTWDDRIPDPDNETQLRQIDISILRDAFFTIVECRVHKDPQDVTWIEELMGRRESLGANAAIAVSASGFTSGAMKKAEAKGIILRTLSSLSTEEIKSWGRPVDVQISTYRFLDCAFDLTVPQKPDEPAHLRTAEGNAIDLMPLFGGVMDWLEAQSLEDGIFVVETDIEADVLISGLVPSTSVFIAKVEHKKSNLSLVSAVRYATPNEDRSTQAVVRHFDTQTVEVIDALKEVAIILDLSSASLQPNEYVRAAIVDFGDVREMKGFHVIGVESLDYSGPLAVRARFPQP